MKGFIHEVTDEWHNGDKGMAVLAAFATTMVALCFITLGAMAYFALVNDPVGFLLVVAIGIAVVGVWALIIRSARK